MRSTDDATETFRLNKDSGLNFRMRRQPEWNETYLLYRDRVILNRLTQRQSVNVPLMKTQVKTILKDIDEAPILTFESLDNDEQKEIFFNEYWKKAADDAKIVIKDIVDKKQVLLFGRSFKKLNIINGQFTFEIVACEDIIIDRYVDPSDIDSARNLIQEHIYKPLVALRENSDYDQKVVDEIAMYYGTEEGLLESNSNAQDAFNKQSRMEAMGVPDVYNPVLGETYVELNEHFVYDKPSDGEDERLYFEVYACTGGGNHLLLRKPLNEVIGDTQDDYWFNHLPYTSWGDDIERTDFWSDGVGDVLRTPNKVLNSIYSQEVENRTLKNFSMNLYDSTNEDFVPQTFDPRPFGWYPTPGDPDKVVKQMAIADLSDANNLMQFIIDLTEKATAATSAVQGDVEDRQVTLGEVQLALSNAQARLKSISVFYNQSWEEFGQKYVKMMEAAYEKLSELTVHKKGRHGLKNYTRVISPDDWVSQNMYRVVVKAVVDQTGQDIEEFQKLQAVQQFFPGNVPLTTILKKKALDIAGLNVNEVKEVLDFDKQQTNTAAVNNPGMNPMGAQPPALPGAPMGLPPGGQPALPAPQPAQPAPSLPPGQPPTPPQDTSGVMQRLMALKDSIKGGGANAHK